MKADEFLHSLVTIAEAPNGIAQLRDLLVHLAVHGHLVAQEPTDDPSSQLLSQIAEERVQLAKALNARAPRSLPPPTADECPGETPEGWTWVRVGSVTEFHYGKALKASNRHDNGSVPVYGSNGVTGFHDESITSSSAIIVGRKGSAGALNLAATPCWPTDVTYFIQVPSAVDIRYWLLVLKSADLPSLAGGIKPGLNRNEAYKIVVGLPPLAEQHRIVARVDELMALLDRLEAAKEARDATRAQLRDAALAALQNANDAEEVKTAWSRIADHMHDLFTDPDDIQAIRHTIVQLAVRGRLSGQDNADEPANELLDRIEMERARLVQEKKIRKPMPLPPISSDAVPFDLPAGWQWCRLGSITSEVTSGSRGWNKYYSDSGATFIRSQDIKHDRLQYDDRAFVQIPPGAEGTRTRIMPGDWVLTITGANVGKCALLDAPPSEAYVSQHVALLRPIEVAVGRFGHVWLTGNHAGRGLLLDGSYGAKPGLNLTQLRELPFPMPPLAEQRRIVAKFDEVMLLLDRLGASLVSARETQGLFCASAVRALPGDSLRVGDGSAVAVE